MKNIKRKVKAIKSSDKKYQKLVAKRNQSKSSSESNRRNSFSSEVWKLTSYNEKGKTNTGKHINPQKFNSPPKLPSKCHDCHKNEAKHLVCKCFLLKKKCETCKNKDLDIINNHKEKEGIFLCSYCFSNNSSTKSSAEELDKSPSSFLNKKRKKEKMAENLLDLDKLYKSVTPPEEIKLYNTKMVKVDDSEDLEPQENTLRKSERIKNNLFTVNAINCHRCKRITTTQNTVTCGEESCRESFCFKCIKKFYPRGFSASKILQIKCSVENKRWVCFKCRKACHCKNCKESWVNTQNNVPKITKEEPGKISIKPKKNKIAPRRRIIIKKEIVKNNTSNVCLVKKRKNIITIPFNHTDNFISEPKNIVRIDDFIVYENTDSEKEEESEKEIQVEKQEDYDKMIVETVEPAIAVNNPTSIISENKKISRKIFLIAENVEKFYSKRFLNNVVIQQCIFCERNNFQTNSLLRFKSFSDLLHYFKYCFTFKYDLICHSKEIFDANRKDIENFYDDYLKMTSNEEFNKKFMFKTSRNSCKVCFDNLLNESGALTTLKTVLTRKLKEGKTNKLSSDFLISSKKNKINITKSEQNGIEHLNERNPAIILNNNLKTNMVADILNKKNNLQNVMLNQNNQNMNLLRNMQMLNFNPSMNTNLNFSEILQNRINNQNLNITHQFLIMNLVKAHIANKLMGKNINDSDLNNFNCSENLNESSIKKDAHKSSSKNSNDNIDEIKILSDSPLDKPKIETPPLNEIQQSQNSNNAQPQFYHSNLTNLLDKILNSKNSKIVRDNLLDKILTDTFSGEETFNALLNNERIYKLLKIGGSTFNTCDDETLNKVSNNKSNEQNQNTCLIEDEKVQGNNFTNSEDNKIENNNFLNEIKNSDNDMSPKNKMKLFGIMNQKLDEIIQNKLSHIKNASLYHNKITQFLIRNLEKITNINSEISTIYNSVDKLVVSLSDTRDTKLKSFDVNELANCIKYVINYYQITQNYLNELNYELKLFIMNNQNSQR